MLRPCVKKPANSRDVAGFTWGEGPSAPGTAVGPTRDLPPPLLVTAGLRVGATENGLIFGLLALAQSRMNPARAAPRVVRPTTTVYEEKLRIGNSARLSTPFGSKRLNRKNLVTIDSGGAVCDPSLRPRSHGSAPEARLRLCSKLLLPLEDLPRPLAAHFSL